jgi:hypothetical protein
LQLSKTSSASEQLLQYYSSLIGSGDRDTAEERSPVEQVEVVEEVPVIEEEGTDMEIPLAHSGVENGEDGNGMERKELTRTGTSSSAAAPAKPPKPPKPQPSAAAPPVAEPIESTLSIPTATGHPLPPPPPVALAVASSKSSSAAAAATLLGKAPHLQKLSFAPLSLCSRPFSNSETSRAEFLKRFIETQVNLTC